MTLYAPALLVPDEVPELITIDPTGAVSYPVIVFDGPESAGKSWQAAAATGDPRFGQSYWICWGAGDWKTVHEYRDVPGASYKIVPHDGHFWSIYGRVRAVKKKAYEAHAAGEPPVLLVMDSMTSEWNQIKTWVYQRAAASESGRKALARDPHAIIKPGRNLWNDGRDRHRALMTQLLTGPWVVILIVRAGWVSGTDENGQPTSEQEWKLDAHESLAFDANLCIRFERAKQPVLWKARSVRAGIAEGIDTSTGPRQLERGFSTSWMVYDVLGVNPATAHFQISDQDEPLALTARPAPTLEPDGSHSGGPEGGREQQRQRPGPHGTPPGQPQPTPIDWAAALKEAREIKDPVAQHQELRNLWTAANYARAEQIMIDTIAAAGELAKRNVEEAAEKAATTAAAGEAPAGQDPAAPAVDDTGQAGTQMPASSTPSDQEAQSSPPATTPAAPRTRRRAAPTKEKSE